MFLSFFDVISMFYFYVQSGAGGRGFDPGPRLTKGVKNGTSGYLAWRIRQTLALLSLTNTTNIAQKLTQKT